MWSEGNSELPVVSLLFLVLDSLKQQVKSKVLLILIDAPLDDREVGHVVWRNSVGDHSLVHEDCLVYHVSLDASLDHASIDKDSWLHSLGLHLVKDSQ